MLFPLFPTLKLIIVFLLEALVPCLVNLLPVIQLTPRHSWRETSLHLTTLCTVATRARSRVCVCVSVGIGMLLTKAHLLQPDCCFAPAEDRWGYIESGYCRGINIVQSERSFTELSRRLKMKQRKEYEAYCRSML